MKQTSAQRPSIATGLLLTALVLAAPAADQRDSPSAAEVSPPSHRIILVTLDGVRVEEVFGGMDEAVARAFARSRGARLEQWPLFESLKGSSAEERRRKLMPFLWGTLLRRHGSIAGNPERGSRVLVGNRFGYSLPGYAEMLTGRTHDDAVVDNEPLASPAETLLERARRELGLEQREVAVFASWRRIEGIAESHPGMVLVNAGPRGDAEAPFPDLRSDEETTAAALAHLAAARPRLLYLSLGETDDWAHAGRYDRVLEAYRTADEALRRIWHFVERDSDFAGRTLLLVTTDHGRGRGTSGWMHHGPGIQGTEDGFMVFVSPESLRRGEWTSGEPLVLGQAAPTLAAWLGLGRDPRSARAVNGVVGSSGSGPMASR